MSVSSFAQKIFLSLRSRRKHKAWGASPRYLSGTNSPARECGRQIKYTKYDNKLAAHGLSPISWARTRLLPVPGAYAPGFMLAPAPQAKVRDFATLAKPEITFMVMISAGLATVLASSSLQLVVLVNSMLGTGLVAGGAGALNQYFERTLDGKMRRTSSRPLPSGHVSGAAALLMGILLTVSGTIYLSFFLNTLTGVLGLLTLLTYVFIYTPLKTRTSLCTLIGAFPGAAPMLMGWAAVQTNLTLEAWALYLILFLWQFPHFYAIGWIYREDYGRAGMKMLPAIDEDDGKTTFRRILISTQLLIVASLLFTLAAPASRLYLVLSLSLGLSFYYVAYRASLTRSKLAAKTLLHASVIYLPLLYLAMLLDKVYQMTTTK